MQVLCHWQVFIAKEDCTYGFSGKRIVLSTTHEKLPMDFQASGFAKKYGMVDIVSSDDEIDSTVLKLLQLHNV